MMKMQLQSNLLLHLSTINQDCVVRGERALFLN
jgi:hypothetical protein